MWPSQLAFLLLSVGYSLPAWLFFILRNFSHDLSNWLSPSFSSTTFQKYVPCIFSQNLLSVHIWRHSLFWKLSCFLLFVLRFSIFVLKILIYLFHHIYTACKGYSIYFCMYLPLRMRYLYTYWAHELTAISHTRLLCWTKRKLNLHHR
jgi:hypothetical protein